MSNRLIDLVGTQFERMTVIERAHNSKRGQAMWRCRCVCGVERIVCGGDLRSGNTKSCGCLSREKARWNAKDMVGLRFGRLLVCGRSGTNRWGAALWVCDCDCGGRAIINGKKLRSGHTQSCGCIKSEAARYIKFRDLTGWESGRLTVAFYIGIDTGKEHMWMCNCVCGGTIEVTHVHLTQRNTRSCGCLKLESSRANLEWINQHQKGENHPRWNPILTQAERVRGRQYPEYSAWVLDVYRRDHFTCQICGHRGSPLCAHHLDGYSWCKSRRTVLSNGVTLCQTCHLQFHSMYGKHSNKHNQFKFFKAIQNRKPRRKRKARVNA